MNDFCIEIEIVRERDGQEEFVCWMRPDDVVQQPILARNFTNLLRSTDDPSCSVVIRRQGSREIIGRLSGSELDW